VDPAAEQLQFLLDLDARHDDLLQRLDELEQRIAGVLAEYGVAQSPPHASNAPMRLRVVGDPAEEIERAA
jgi:hypothetical protein